MPPILSIIAAFALGWYVSSKDPASIEWSHVTLYVYVALLVVMAELAGRYHGKAKAQKKHIENLQEIIEERAAAETDAPPTRWETESMAEAMHDAFELHTREVRDITTWRGKKTNPDHLQECNAWREVAKAAFNQLN